MLATTASRTLAEACRHLELEPKARALVKPDMKPEEFIGALREHACDLDALQVLANWLAKREAVWWGCLCTWHADRAALTPVEDAALVAAVHWVQEPSEEHRRAAGDAAERAGLGSLAGGVAKAVFWSGGSMNPPRLPAVPPPPALTAVMLARALHARTLKASGGERRQARHDIFTLGHYVARGMIPLSFELNR